MGCYSAMSGRTWDLDTFCTDEQRRLIRLRAFAMRGSRKFCQGGQNMAFQRGWGGDPDTTVSGPSSAHQRNQMRFAGVPMMAQY